MIDNVEREVDEGRNLEFDLSEVESGSAKAELSNRRKLEGHRGCWSESGEALQSAGELESGVEGDVDEGETMEG